MVVISLFDLTGKALEPWRDAGYTCYAVDIQHPVVYDRGGITERDGIYFVRADLSNHWLPPCDRDQIAFVYAFPPCDHLSVSGARWFKGKGLRALARSVQLFATAAEFCEWSGSPYLIENPVSSISSYWRKPDYTFHPHQFTGYCEADNYTKKTCLWVGGGFVMPTELKADLGEPDDRIHKAPPSAERANFRSATPDGFSRAVFLANSNQRGAA